VREDHHRPTGRRLQLPFEPLKLRAVHIHLVCAVAVASKSDGGEAYANGRAQAGRPVVPLLERLRRTTFRDSVSLCSSFGALFLSFCFPHLCG
jgi:hypothetical protein